MKEKRNYLIAGLVCAFAFMAVGYSALAQQLTIRGTANVTSTWNIGITSITKTATNGTATELAEPSHDSTSATFSVDLKSPGDYIIYDVTIANQGSIPAVLSSITLNPNVPATTGIKYTVTGVEAGDKLAATTGTHTVQVKVEWVSTDTTVPEVTTQNLTATLNYSQDTSA